MFLALTSFRLRTPRALLSIALLATSSLCRLSVPAKADGNLTLELPPSDASIEAREARAAEVQTINMRSHAAALQASARRRSSVRHRASAGLRGKYASRGGAADRTMGQLGMLTNQTPIYRATGSGTVLATAQPGTYLAIRAERGAWYGVLMADGSLGWMRKSGVRLMDYEVVSAGVSTAPYVPAGSDEGDIYPRSGAPFFNGDAQPLLTEAYRYLGVPYVWGGNTARGIDCSGFIRNVFGACGYGLPRLGSDQMAYGVPVPADQLQAGDRLYFGRRTERVGVTHTGLYIGNGYFIHASSSRHGVAVSRLDEAMFRRIYVCARR